MANTTNKVHFNLKNVHFAPATVTDGVTTYDTPIHNPGAVSVDLSQNGDKTTFYADGVEYWVMNTNSGYDGDLEVALFIEAVYKALWDYIEADNKTLWEKADAETKHFAFGFQIDGDVSETLFWLLNCTATRPNIASQTNEENKTPRTQTSSLSCRPNAEGYVLYKTKEDTSAEERAAWFTAPPKAKPTTT